MTMTFRNRTEAGKLLAPKVPIITQVQSFPLEKANEALEALRNGKINGAAVLVIN